MTSLTRALLGPLAGALCVFAACSDPSNPEPDWFEGGDDVQSGGEDDSGAGASHRGGSGSGAQGGRSGGSARAGNPGRDPSGDAGAPAEGEGEGGSIGLAGAPTDDPRAGSANASGGKSSGAAGSGRGGSGGRASGSGGSGSGASGSAPGASGMTGEAGAASGPDPEPGDDFFGESRCSDEFLFCDGFESETLAADWRPQGTRPTFDDSRKARGNRSAHFQAEGHGLSILRFTLEEPTYYGRMFIYLEALPTAPRWAHWTVAAATGTGVDAEIRVGGQFDGETNRFGVGTDHGPTADWTLLSEEQDSVPLDTWVCVEWLHDSANNETRFWSDEVEHTSLHTTLTEHGGEGDYELPAFTEVFVGWWQYAMDPTPASFHLWVDEVAFATERIGCTR